MSFLHPGTQAGAEGTCTPPSRWTCAEAVGAPVIVQQHLVMLVAVAALMVTLLHTPALQLQGL
tara:strand:+ start:124 stop:312 length:189 start_codon:yes stop_codon:yes gene_type:complete